MPFGDGDRPRSGVLAATAVGSGLTSRHVGRGIVERAPDDAPLMLSAYGDATNPRVQSGLPFYLLAEAQRQGLVSGALPLTPTTSARYHRSRAAWNARRLVTGHRPGGFRYSVSGQELEWGPLRRIGRDVRLLRCYQLIAASRLEDRAPRTWFYIDITLGQLFGSLYEQRSLGDVAAKALELEGRGYRASRGVITRSAWAAQSVISDHGVDPRKVHVVLPGANLDHALYATWEKMEAGRRSGSGESPKDSPVRFVYVGYDWKRKGLDRLLRAHALARRQGSRALLRVIGCQRSALPSELRYTPGVEWCGVIDKRTHAQTYMRLVAECDVGCLLSYQEAAGISLREYGALGLAVMATTAGGAPENVRAGASVLVDAEAGEDVIAYLLLRLSTEKDWRDSLRATAWTCRRDYSWTASVERLAAIIDGGPAG